MLVRSITQNAAPLRRASTSASGSTSATTLAHFLRPKPPVGFFTANTSASPAFSTSPPAHISETPSLALKSSSVKHEPSVPIVNWTAGKRSETAIQVPTEQAAEVVKPLQGDLQRTAQPLRQELSEQLTPTLKGFTLGGKVAVVTGAGRGLGFNMAQGLAEVGVRGIAILDMQQDIGDRAAQELGEQTGVDVRFYRVDVRDDLSVQHAVQDVVNHFGEINILINAAGIADSNIKAHTYPLDKFRRLLDINLTGTFITSRAVAATAIASHHQPAAPATTSAAHGGLSIINIASMSASIVNYPQEQCAYNASKAGVVQLTKSLAAEWAKYGIRVNTISPGYMDTALNRVPSLDAQKSMWVDRTPMRRLGGVGELNGVAVWLAGGGSGFVTGADVVVDGGYTLW